METLFIGKNIIFLPETGSTNSYATDLLKNVNLPEGTVVHTMNQTKGRGQRDTSWNAEPQRNLTFSVILKPTFLPIKNQFFLYQVIALACYDAMAEIIDSSQFDIKIKWPNDILVNMRKIAGILIENTIHNNQIVWSVVGIGINVNQQVFGDRVRATSLRQLSGKEYDVKHVLEIVCRQLEKHYFTLLNLKYSVIAENYLQHLYGLNQYLDFEIQGTVRSLQVKGLSAGGLLVLQEKSGKEMEVDVKEIKWLY